MGFADYLSLAGASGKTQYNVAETEIRDANYSQSEDDLGRAHRALSIQSSPIAEVI